MLDDFCPVPAGKRWREVPYIPYLNFAPSAWTLSLVYAGGGLNSLGGIAIDGNDQIVYLSGGDASRGRILGRTLDGKPVDGTLQVEAPYYLAIDQQNRIWVTNSGTDTVTRFPANDSGNAETFKVGFAPRAVAIDSQGNAWVANTVGHPDTAEKLASIKANLVSRVESLAGSMSKVEAEAKEWIDLFEILNEYPRGEVSMIRAGG